MRLQRALARAGIASRRAAEELIRAGQVRVDGKVAELGSRVDPARQKITVRGRPVAVQARRWLAFHKPLGVVTTARDEQGRPTVLDLLDHPPGLTYVGRLDVNTTGLLLLTTDGEAVHRLTHPRYRIPRSYVALVHGQPPAEVAGLVQRRVVLDDRPVVLDRVSVKPGREGRCVVSLTLHEGRNRVVRRWAEALGLRVDRLARVSFGPVRLDDLPVGRTRPLTPAEERGLYRAIGLAADEG